MEMYQCRPCRKTYTAAEVQGRRSCPSCKGPLIGQKQLENYQAETLASLNRLKHQSTLTLAGGAILAMAIQSGIDWYENSTDFRALTWMVGAGSIAGLAAAGFWWKTGKRSLILVASLIFQVTALVYAFSVFAASGPLFEMGRSRGLTNAILFVALTPLGLSLLAWHQYKSYVAVLRP